MVRTKNDVTHLDEFPLFSIRSHLGAGIIPAPFALALNSKELLIFGLG